MRCPDCNKFVAYDDSQQPETNLDIDDEGRISGDVRVFLACAECGTELKEGTFEVEDDLSAEFDKHKQQGGECIVTITNSVNEEVTFEIKVDTLADLGQVAREAALPIIEAARANGKLTTTVGLEVDVNEPEHDLEIEDGNDTEMTVEKKKGKTHYGHHTTITVKCSCGKFEDTREFNDSMTSSEMDELT